MVDLASLQPRLIYGTAWKKDETAHWVQRAIANGFRAIDTAGQPKHYHEAGVGEGIAASLSAEITREALYLQTKFTPLSGQDPHRLPYDPHATPAQQVEQSFASSLRNLRTDYVDGLVLHSPVSDPGIWQAMEAIVGRGGARSLGISNCYHLAELRRLYQTARVKPTVVQNRFYADTGYDREIRAFCADHGIVYQSFWTLTANPHLLTSPTLQSLGQRLRRSPAQILFRYLTQRGVVPLTGTRSEAHMREDLAIFEFTLDPADCTAIDQLL